MFRDDGGQGKDEDGSKGGGIEEDDTDRLCQRVRALIDIVNHKFKELSRTYSIDHAIWKDAEVARAYHHLGEEHKLFVIFTSKYTKQYSCRHN